MKLPKDVNGFAFLGALSLTLVSASVSAGSMGTALPEPGPWYLGVFGGAGSATSEDTSQHGTAFLTTGGPLAVNAYGQADSNTAGIGGAHLGYKWRSFDNSGSKWALTPALELEGYYLGLTQNGIDLDNNTVRLDEHEFAVSYPMDNGVFLLNGVLNFNNLGWGSVTPYMGGGLGAAIISISGAESTQVAPAEPGVNHYNSDTNASDWTFAAQYKVGLNFNISPQASIFAEYRFLYLSPTSYTFGSTQYPTHAPTTNWNVQLDSMYYNMGTIGIHYDV